MSRDLKDAQQMFTEKVSYYERHWTILRWKRHRNTSIQDSAKKKSELEGTNRKLRSDYLAVQGQGE